MHRNMHSHWTLEKSGAHQNMFSYVHEGNLPSKPESSTLKILIGTGILRWRWDFSWDCTLAHQLYRREERKRTERQGGVRVPIVVIYIKPLFLKLEKAGNLELGKRKILSSFSSLLQSTELNFAERLDFLKSPRCFNFFFLFHDMSFENRNRREKTNWRSIRKKEINKEKSIYIYELKPPKKLHLKKICFKSSHFDRNQPKKNLVSKPEKQNTK